SVVGVVVLFFFQAEDGIRDFHVTGVQTCALPISRPAVSAAAPPREHRRKQRRPRTGGGGRANRPGSARGAGGERGREGCGNGTGPARGAGPAGPGGGAGRSVGWVGGSPWPARTPQVNRNAISARATTAV